MNNLIKKLAEESGLLFLPHGFIENDMTNEQIQHFAQLIVEECRTVLSEQSRKAPLECAGHFLNADNAIMEHFYRNKI